MTTWIPTIARRSPVHDLLEPMQPVWTEVQGMPAVLRFVDPDREEAARERLALADLSCLSRLGLKGEGVDSWLEDQNLEPPRSLYSVASMDGHGILARIDREEVFLEDGIRGEVVSRIRNRLADRPPGVYAIERPEASFLLGGTRADEVLRQTCGSPFGGSDELVMGRLAGVACRLWPVDLDGIVGYRMWLDPSYGVYLWETLLGIVREEGGAAVGLGCIYPGLSPAGPRKGRCS